jgi:hypothetical protein
MPWRVPVHRPTGVVLNTIHMWWYTLTNAGVSNRDLKAERQMMEDVVEQRDNLLEYIATIQPMDWQVFQSAMQQSGLFGASVSVGLTKNPHDFLRAVLAKVIHTKIEAQAASYITGGVDQILAALFKAENTWAILRYLDEVLRRQGISADGLSTGTPVQEDKEVHEVVQGDHPAIPETTRPHRP